MTPSILVVVVFGGLGTSASPMMLRFPSFDDCANAAPAIVESLRRQTVKTGASTIAPQISFECVADGSEIGSARR